MNRNRLSKRIRFARSESGLSQEDFGARLNVSRGRVSSWENGVSVPDEETLVKIAEITKFPLSFFTESEFLIEDPLKAEKSVITPEVKNELTSTDETSRVYEAECKEVRMETILSAFLYVVILALSFFTIPFGFVFAVTAIFIVPDLTRLKKTKLMVIARELIRILTIIWAVYLFGAFLFAYGWLPKWLIKVEVFGPE